MRKVTLYTEAQALAECHQLFRQHMTNISELSKHCPNQPRIVDALHALYEAVDAVDDWIGASGHIGITVLFQPTLFDFETDDHAYGDDYPF